MVTKQQEYQARFFQLIGFGFMTPAGNIFLKIPELKITDINIKLCSYILISIVFVFLGIILNIKGMECLEERENKWIQ